MIAKYGKATNMTEAELQMTVANYIRVNYPDVIFRSDFGSGLKLTMGQAIKQKRMNGGLRAFPDMAIYEPAPRCIDGSWDHEWHGLLIELKKDGTRLKKKNGEWATLHIAEQAEVLKELGDRGYRAEFAVGFPQARKLIDDYMKFKGGNYVNF